MNLVARLSASCLIALGSLALGCSAGADEDASESGDALSSAQVPGAAGVEQEGVTTGIRGVGQSAKVRRIMSAIKTVRGAQPEVMCDPRNKATLYRFFDEHGEVIANATSRCGQGVVDVVARPGVEAKQIRVRFDTREIEATLTEPLVPADILYPVTTLVLKRQGEAPASVTLNDRERVAEVMQSIEASKIDISSPTPRCPPSRSVTFMRGEEVLGSIGYACSASSLADGETTGTFTGMSRGTPPDGDPVLFGGVKLDPRVIERLLDKPEVDEPGDCRSSGCSAGWSCKACRTSSDVSYVCLRNEASC